MGAIQLFRAMQGIETTPVSNDLIFTIDPAFNGLFEVSLEVSAAPVPEWYIKDATSGQILFFTGQSISEDLAQVAIDNSLDPSTLVVTPVLPDFSTVNVFKYNEPGSATILASGIINLSLLTGIQDYSVNSTSGLTEVIFPTSSVNVTSLIFIATSTITGVDISGLSNIGLLVPTTGNAILRIWDIHPNLIAFPVISNYVSLALDAPSGEVSGAIDLSNLTGIDYVLIESVRFASVDPYTGPITWPVNIHPLRLIGTSGETSIGFIDLSTLSSGFTSINNGIYSFGMMGLSAAQVNEMLVALDNSSVGGFTGRIIRFNNNVIWGSANAAPDGSSGGFNGAAAKASLQGKGFTVSTN